MITKNKNIENTKQRILFFVIALFLSISSFNSLSAQMVGINNNGGTPSTSAVLDLSCNLANTKGGFLLPTLTTTQMNDLLTPTATVNPPNGTLIFNSTVGCMEAYYNNAWQQVICPCSGAPGTPSISGSTSIASASTGNTYSAASAGASTYSWSVQATIGTISGSSTGSSITMNAATVGSNTTGTITCTATNNCGSSTNTYTVTVTTTCSGTISKDVVSVQNQQYDATSSFTITTTHTNEVVLIMANGLSDIGSYSGTITVSGGSASAVTVIKNSSASDGYFFTNSEIAGFIAATAATYTITVPRSNNDYDINNVAVALYGFCSTATIAANVTNIAVTVKQANGSNNSSLSGSITPTIANSFLVANYYNWTFDNNTGTVTWPSPTSGDVLLATDNNNNDGMDGSVDGYAQSAVAAVTFTVNDVDSYGADMWIANLQMLDVHN